MNIRSSHSSHRSNRLRIRKTYNININYYYKVIVYYGLERIARIDELAEYFYLYDAHGDVRGLADVAGQVISTVDYDA